jgi:hypothetical protein
LKLKKFAFLDLKLQGNYVFVRSPFRCIRKLEKLQAMQRNGGIGDDKLKGTKLATFLVL